MARSGRTWISISVAAVLALVLLAGILEIKGRIGISTRPWFLETYLEKRLAECRTGPDAYEFRNEYRRLAARALDAKLAVLETNRKWWFWRDYSANVLQLLSTCVDAQALRIRMALRSEDEQRRLEVFLRILKSELDADNSSGKIWNQFDLRNLERRRAETLTEEAVLLQSQGNHQSALASALRAWAALQRFDHSSGLVFARFGNSSLRRQWDREAEALLRWTKTSGRRAILVDKLAHLCALLGQGRIEKTYAANLGRNWYLPKEMSQDAATPEGTYKVNRLNAAGRYGYALMIDYPNADDSKHFQALKRQGSIPSSARIGSNIEIHGGGRSASDWTEGCVALRDADMRDLYRYAYIGMPVTIVGASSLSSGLTERAGISK
jgi:L,D-peptidoglycan transpeptidase YkuD (ErfK/YbiS/YcfS/YnhG family)